MRPRRAGPDVMPHQGATIVRRLALVPILAAALLFPTVAGALGLGEIEVHSALNQRLDAQIPLRGVPAGGAGDVIVALASEKAFRDVGLQRPHALTRLQFEIRQRGDGRHYVHVTSSEPIAEPFLSFLLEVDGPGGNLLREYTVLLDPPVFATERSRPDADTAAAAPEAPGAGEAEMAAAASAGEIERGDADTATQAQPETAERPESERQVPEQPETVAAAAEGGAGERTEFGETPVFLQVEREQARAERDAPAPAPEREREAADEALVEAYQPGSEDADESAAGAAGSGARMPAEHGPVERGDTLWSIASRLRRGDMSVQQLMLALLRYNPEAFADGNINRLKRGYVLRIPEEAEIRSVPAQQAIARVRDQNTLWREWRAAARGEGGETAVAQRSADTAPADTDAPAAAGDDESRLSIVGSEEGGASSDESASATSNDRAAEQELELAREQLESARMEKAELESRVDDLEDTVDKMERLITLRENQLAQLQDQLQKLQQQEAERAEAAEAAEARPDEGGADGDAAGDGGAAASGGDGNGGGDGDTSGTPEAGDADAGTATAAGDGAIEQPAEAAPAEPDAGVVTTRTEASPDGWLDRVTGMAAGIAGSVTAAVTGTLAGLAGGMGGPLFAGPTSPGVLGAAALLLLALAGLLVVRRRRAADGNADFEDMDEAALADAAETDEVDLGGMYAGSDLIAEEIDSDEAVGGGRAQGGASPLDEAFDLGALEADSGEDAPSAASPEDEAPKDDTVAEAEVYLAYGLHQQAEDLLRLALRESPERADYHEKLLETLYAAGKKGEFVTEAGTFHGMVDSSDSRMWQRVVAMGREVAPEHELFRKSAAPDVRPEELQQTRPATADIELDPGEGGAGGEEDDFARSLMPDADELGGDTGPGESRSGGSEEAAGEGDDDLEFDLGDFEQLAGGDDAETAAGERGAEAAGDADEALDFDLADLGGGAEADADEGGLDFDIGLGEAPAAAGAEETAAATDTGEVPDLDLGDLEFEAGAGTDAGGDSGGYALDIGDLSSGSEPDSGGGAAGDDEDDDEFDTMLDLARAYIDMGDPESASNALEEVIESGSDKQRTEARSLLETVQ